MPAMISLPLRYESPTSTTEASTSVAVVKHYVLRMQLSSFYFFGLRPQQHMMYA